MQHGTPSSSPVSLSLQTERERGGEIGEWEVVKKGGREKEGGGKKSSAGSIRIHIFTCPARGKGGQGVGGAGQDFFAKSTEPGNVFGDL